ncbi:MAG: ammonium transporter [Marinilabiliales bacterium]|nr:ammonium transporter [Marinilabiliales bacterium]
MKRSWQISLFVILILSLAGVYVAGKDPFELDPKTVPGDVAWMLTSTALVLFMTPGLAFFYGGMIQPKNIISTMLQSFVAMGVISLIWVIVGFSLAFGDSIGPEKYGLFGNPFTFFMFKGVGGNINAALAPTIPLALFAIFQMKFAIITPALITGSFAGRVRFSSYILFISLFALFIYAPLAHWTWHPNGFLRNWGVLDFAGGTVVHMSAGFAALAGAVFLGPRRDYQQQFHPANIPFVLLGASMLWFGWFGFNAGSALASNSIATLALMNTNVASAAAMIGFILFDVAMGRKPSAMGSAIGLVVGLVAITPAAGFVNIGAAIFIGLFASFICNLAISYRSKTSLDDTLDVFPAHGMGGIIGMILTAVFAQGVGLFYGETKTFLFHMLALVIVGVYAFGGSYLLYLLTNKILPMRVDPKSERLGLDITQHDESYSIEKSVER